MRAVKLSHRLFILHQFYRDENHIWDIGCDHGKLGLSFLGKEGVQKIFLVDPATQVIDNLYETLKDSDIPRDLIFVIHQKGQDIKLKKLKKNIIFLAGMGGKEIMEILLNLLPQLDHTSQIVISPHKNILELRSFLHHQESIFLSEESLCFENGHFYQILSLRINSGKNKVSLFGDSIWKSQKGDQYALSQLNFFSLHQNEASQRYVEFLRELLEL